jgi:hypothetical protein
MARLQILDFPAGPNDDRPSITLAAEETRKP